MDILAEIKEIKYTPLLTKDLKSHSFNDIETALSKNASFILEIDELNKIALSSWVSPKRTRSYPYTRVYNTLSFSGKKATIIPIIKDEGKAGDRDYLEWDTVSLMSLLDIFVIISYYNEALKSKRYSNKITRQRFNIGHIKEQIKELLSYRSNALHWNLSQIDKLGEVGLEALKSYDKISNKLGIEMHSASTALRRIEELLKGRDTFMLLSRGLAEKAQRRESLTIQPKEKLEGEKATLTFKNAFGGHYFLTCDEAKICQSSICLVEGKHTNSNNLPSLNDIRDGLLKMILFTNLVNITINNQNYKPIPVLKLTTRGEIKNYQSSKKLNNTLSLLKREAEINGFKVLINNTFLI